MTGLLPVTSFGTASLEETPSLSDCVIITFTGSFIVGATSRFSGSLLYGIPKEVLGFLGTSCLGMTERAVTPSVREGSPCPPHGDASPT